MQEDFLHYIWKHKKINFNNLKQGGLKWHLQQLKRTKKHS